MSFEHLPAVQAEVEELAQRFAAAGHRLFLVGGIVRDLWMGDVLDAASDIDLTTDARPPEIKALVANWADAVWTQGERFGTIGLEKDGRAIEITTFRAEEYVPDSRKPEVAFGEDIFADLARRDFTVNAMAWEVPTGELIDPHGGTADLDDRQLRTPLSPEVSFTDDPLRMIRAARFVNRFAMTASPELLAAATELRDRLDIVAIERIRDELEKLLNASTVHAGLGFLHQTGLLDKVIAGAGEASVDLAVAVDVTGVDQPWLLRTAALIAPLASTRTTVGACVDALRCSNDDRRTLEYVVPGAHALAEVADTDEAVRRWVVGAGGVAADAWRLGQAMHGLDQLAAFGERWRFLASIEDLESTAVPLNGQEIAALLEEAEGPRIGEAVRVLQDHRLVHGPFDADEGRRVLRDWNTS